MRSSLYTALLASVAGVSATASSRPQVVPSPFEPRLPVPSSAERNKTCSVKTHGNGTDDSDYILSAFNACNYGGHVIFNKNTTYTIGTAMDWTFLQSIDIGRLPSHPLSTCVPSTCAEPRTCCHVPSENCSTEGRLGVDAVHIRGTAR